MEKHYTNSLSTSIVKILLQCGFESASKRALDEFVGLSLNYVRNLSSKMSALTNQCNLMESDILIGLGALKLHGDNLDELFSFLQNYNEIFPPPPKVFHGPVSLKTTPKVLEDKPTEIVPWAPEMTTALATIGMKLKNRQIISDPHFDRSKFLALSLKSPIHGTNGSGLDNKSHNFSSCSSQSASNVSGKYGSGLNYILPSEAYPHKYEAPTIDLDTNGVVVGLNGRCGKLPDPYINDLEEQDILRQKSKFSENHSAMLTFPHQLFNGIRKKQHALGPESCYKSSPAAPRGLSSDHYGHDNDDDHDDDVCVTRGTPTLQHYPSNHIDRTVTSDDAWNAALQATVTTYVNKPDPYVLDFDAKLSPTIPSTPSVKKHKKRHRSSSQQRPKKMRRLHDKVHQEDIVSQIYQNESTMDSRFSDAVPYSPSPDRHDNYNHSYLNNYQIHHVKDRSPSFSPQLRDSRPEPSPYEIGSQIMYYSEIIPSQSFSSTSKSKKKKTSRKTHFTNKRKKKPPQPASANFHYQFDHLEDDPPPNDDNESLERHSLAFSYNPQSQASSPILNVVGNYVDESDDDGTEPMKESSEEMLKMLEIPPDSNQNHRHLMVDSPPHYPLQNNKYGHGLNNTLHDNSSEGGIRMKIKLFKGTPDTNRADSYVNSVHTDLSSPLGQSPQHSDDRNSVTERLNFMRDDESPLSDVGRPPGPLQYNSPRYDSQRRGPSMVLSTQEPCKDFRRPVTSSVIRGVATSSTFSPPPSQSNPPLKFIAKSVDKLKRHKSGSSHSSPKTLPALDDCDNKVRPPLPLLLKTSNPICPTTATINSTKSDRKRKKSHMNSGSKKSKSKKYSKLKLDIIVPPPKEPTFISVDDVFSDDDDNLKAEPRIHHNSPFVVTIAQNFTNEQPMHHHHQHTPLVVVDKTSPYRLPIPPIKVNSRKSTSSKSKSAKSKTSIMSPALVKPVQPKILYNYSCLQGEAHYESEDGKVVYICPICNTEDNGSLMLQCDTCEDWYHGLCMGIFDPPPEHVEWYCPRCTEDRMTGKMNSSSKATKSTTKAGSRAKRK